MPSKYYNMDADADSVVVGNTRASDTSIGFRTDIQNMFERYATEGIDIARELNQIAGREDLRQQFVENCCESVNSTHDLHSEAAANDPFYSNYGERLATLSDNSLKEIARESVMTGYAPITAYAPFFLKKQWVACVWKDALMSEVATSPVLNYKFEKRYLKTQDGETYEIPDVYYNKAAMKKLYAEATGNDIDSDKAIKLPASNVQLLPHVGSDGHTIESYIKGDLVVNDFNRSEMITANTSICKVTIQEPKSDGSGYESSKTHTIPVNIGVDLSTHNFLKSDVRYIVRDEKGDPKKDDNGNIMMATDELVGRLNFDNGTITIMSTTGAVTEVYLAGKTANRFNHRSLSVERRVERIQKMMPESGPRLNTGITIEEASDAIALDRIDMFADTVNMMGDALAQLVDAEISGFVQNSYEVQKAAEDDGRGGPHGYNTLVEDGGFNAVPYGGYSTNISTWIGDCKEYFERYIDRLKRKLKTQEVTVVCVTAPENVRFLKGDIKWVFSDTTDVSGLKLNYNVGITNINGGDRVHLITSQYLSQEDGIRTILIPTTSELITYKHIFYSVVVDRSGYRNPVETLIPNVMATQRSLTFEILPVQGRFYINGIDSYSPKELPPQAMYIKNPDALGTGTSSEGVGP